jgi:hypothetical protein
MEKASGVSLKSKWLGLTQQEAGKLAHSFVKIEETLSKLPFSSTGSLYFRKDITPSLQTSLYQKDHAGEDDQFCIGPIADYMFWYGRRAGLELNRGPWQSHVDYLSSIAQKEIEWTQRYGRSMEPPTFPHNALGLGVHSPEEHVKILRSYQSLTPHLLPKDPTRPLSQPILRHPDPTPGNIYISPETGRLTCLIDWQHAGVQPRLLAAGYPTPFQNPDNDPPLELEIPNFRKV